MLRRSCLALALAATVSSTAFAAADGFLDPTFGQGGRQTVAFGPDFAVFGAIPGGMAVLPDGRILLAGTAVYIPSQQFGIGLARLTADGQVDEGFGRPWHLHPELQHAIAFDVAVQPDGKLVVAGYAVPLSGGSHSQALVCRFLPDGSVDTGFATVDNALAPGCRVLEGDENAFFAVTVQRDGRIALAGAIDVDDVYHGLVVRLHASGNYDGGFGDGSVNVLLPASTHDTTLTDIAETPTGDLVAVGVASINNNDNWQVFRLRGADGAPDNSFDTDGLKPIGIDLVANGQDQAYAVSVLPDGRIVVGGSAGAGQGTYCPAIARLMPNGQFDNSLDGDGLFTANCLPDLSIQDMLVQSDGRVVLAGSWNQNFFTTRILPEGNIDSDFGIWGTGISGVDFGAHYGLGYGESVDIAYRIASHGGRLLLAGYANPAGAGSTDFAIARLDNDLIYADDLE